MPQRHSLSKFRYVPLPTELLAEIFTIAITLDIPRFSSTHSILVLASVCSFWRTVAIGTPTFWRKIVIPPSAFDFIQLQLARSQPLSLVVDVHPWTSLDRALLALLAEHSERWEEASLGISDSDYSLLTSVRGRLPLLKRLEISTYGHHDAPNFDGFETAPLLREVILAPLQDRFWNGFPIPYPQLTKLQCFDCPLRLLQPILTRVPTLVELHVRNVYSDGLELSSPKIAFPSLQTVTVGNCEASFFHRLLAQTPELTELRVYGFAESGGPGPEATITLPCLRSLYLEEEQYDSYIAQIIESLRVPKLVQLEFKSNSDDEEGDNMLYIDSFKTLIRNSGCELQSLRLLIKADRYLSMLSLLKTTPSLKHLVIEVESLEDIPFFGLTPVSAILPKLLTFVIYAADWDSLSLLNDLIAFAQRSGELVISIQPSFL